MAIAEKGLERLAIDTIRTLSIDAVQKANSGHPGAPMGAAPMAYVVWTRFLRHAPTQPGWPDRDRFVLSAGHASMLLYSLLHLTGYDGAYRVGRVLFRDIVRAAVRAAGDVPVTVKTRIGIDGDHVTYLDAGRIAQDEGAGAITLHGRTADQLYSGTADWSPIARLVDAVGIPVLGNGDIWEASDALRMVSETGAAGANAAKPVGTTTAGQTGGVNPSAGQTGGAAPR